MTNDMKQHAGKKERKEGRHTITTKEKKKRITHMIITERMNERKKEITTYIHDGIIINKKQKKNERKKERMKERTNERNNDRTKGQTQGITKNITKESKKERNTEIKKERKNDERKNVLNK